MKTRFYALLFISFLALISVGILIGWLLKPATMTITNTPIFYPYSDGIPSTLDIQNAGSLTFTTIHYYPQLCYLYGIPYWQFQMPNTPYYTLAPELMPFTEDNIEAGYAVKASNIDGTTEVYIPVSPNTINVSRTFPR